MVQARAKATSVQLTPELLKDEAAQNSRRQQGDCPARSDGCSRWRKLSQPQSGSGFRDLQSQLKEPKTASPWRVSVTLTRWRSSTRWSATFPNESDGEIPAAFGRKSPISPSLTKGRGKPPK